MKNTGILKKLLSILTFVIIVTLTLTSCDIIDDGSISDTQTEADTADTTDTEAVHTCVFDKRVTNEKYLKSPATYTSRAIYFYSCECGQKGTDTFEHGDIIPAEGLVFTEVKNGYEISGYTGNATALIIPSSYNGKPVTGIGEDAFNGCAILESITLPDSIVRIGLRAFYGCPSLKSITVPESVTHICEGAFAYCSVLESITFEDTTSWYKTRDYDAWEQRTGGTLVDLTNPSVNVGHFTDSNTFIFYYKN